MKKTMMVISILVLLLVGCQATAQPAPTPQPQLADSTAVPAEAVQETDAAEAVLQQEAMVALIEDYHAEFNAGNVEAVSALVTEDVVMKIVYGSDDDPVFEGQAALGEVIQGVQQDNFQIEVSDIQTAGDRVTFAYSGIGDGLRELGVGPEVGTAEAVVQDGLIQSLTYNVDPAWVAAADAAEAAQAAPEPTEVPLPEVSIATLPGTWTQTDAEGGNNWLVLHADGAYEAKHGPSVETGILVLEGTYTVEGSVVTFLDVEECAEGGEQYDARFITPNRIRFDLKAQCASLGLLPETPIWQRYSAES